VISPLLGSPTALAVPLCLEPSALHLLYTYLGVLEAVIIDLSGRWTMARWTS
jgi:hypothetical protein